MPKSRRAVARALDAWSKGDVDFSLYLAPELESDVAASRKSTGVDAVDARLSLARALRDHPGDDPIARDDATRATEALDNDAPDTTTRARAVEDDVVDDARVELAEPSDADDDEASSDADADPVDDDDDGEEQEEVVVVEQEEDNPPRFVFEDPPIDHAGIAAKKAERDAARRKADGLRRVRELLAERRRHETRATSSNADGDDADRGDSARGANDDATTPAMTTLHRVRSMLRERRPTPEAPTRDASIADRLAALKLKLRGE